jgi:hypothetical protein
MICVGRATRAAGWVGWLLVGLITLGCDGSPSEPENMVDGGSWYVTGYRWPHDGRPYESENIIVYSDGASDHARQTLAEIGEELLAELKEQFGIADNEIFLFPGGQTKIHIYTYKDYAPTEWGGWGYYGGLLIYSLDHEWRGEIGHTAMSMYVPVVKHELMHVVESLIKASNNPHLVDVWLTEGIAETVSGGTAGGEITDLAELNDRIATYGELNPIAMHVYDYPDTQGVAFDYYYPMFQLAVTYLVEAEGQGRTFEDLKDLLLDVRSGTVFAAAFENRFGISLTEYEERFFDLVRDHLPSSVR